MRQEKHGSPSLFTVPSWQAPDGPSSRADTQQAPPEWLDKAQTLHTAKKQATSSFSRFSMQPQEQRLQDAWARDEKAVLRARADLLNTLMTAEQDPKLCLEVKSKNRVCVMYNRMRCEGDVELGPMQSTMSWVVHGGERAYQQLITAGVHAQPGVMRALLRAVQRSMPPRKDILQPLSALLSKSCPDTLTPKTEAGLLGAEPGQTRVMEGLCKHGRQEAPTYRLVWGALDVNAQEAWQNPSTNASIRLSILETAHAATREAARSKQPLWSSVTHLQVKILHNDECHSLTIAPFCNSEACTVTHLQFVQSVFDASGPERGILNLSQNPEAVHPIPLGRISPMQSYVCLKAHKSGRLNEAQLNYVHSRGLLEHPGFDVALLPSASRLFFSSSSSNGAMPPAKSTRISGTGVDVLASSYHLADQVFTTMTVVQYPPFGTQFGGGLAAGDKRFNPDAPEFSPSQPEEQEEGDEDNGSNTYSEEDDSENGDEYGPEDHESSKTKFEDEDPLYEHTRTQWVIKLGKNGLPRHKSDRWTTPLLFGQYYFVDGYSGDPYDLKDRFVLFEADHPKRYKKAQDKAIEVRDWLIEAPSSMRWDESKSFYDNIKHEIAARLEWRSEWREFLRENIYELNKEHEERCKRKDLDLSSPPLAFWYNENIAAWKDVFSGYMDFDDRRLWDDSKTINEKSTFGKKVMYHLNKPKEWLAYWRDEGFIQRAHIDSVLKQNRPVSNTTGRGCNAYVQKGKKSCTKLSKSSHIPLPVRHTQVCKNDKPNQHEVRTLQRKIQLLETRIHSTRENTNTQHLLRQVLERLDDAS